MNPACARASRTWCPRTCSDCSKSIVHLYLHLEKHDGTMGDKGQGGAGKKCCIHSQFFSHGGKLSVIQLNGG